LARGDGKCLASVPRRTYRESLYHSAHWLRHPYSPQVELATGVHLPVEGWTDARIGQSLKINISLIIAKG